MAYDSNTNIENERTYLNNLIAQGGGNGEWAKNQLKVLDSFASSQQTTKPTTTQPTTSTTTEAIYYTPEGEKMYGYNIDGRTYKDQAGTQRIDQGSYTNAGGQWWQMGKTGGIQVDIPDFAKTLDNMGSYQNLLGNMVFPTFNSENAKNIQGQLGDVLEAIQGFQPTESMSRDESNARAYSQLNNLYNSNLEKQLDNYNRDAVSRGMFGQLPTEALKQNAISESELDKSVAINNLSNDMFMDDFNMARQKDQDFYNQQNMMLNVLAQTYGIESDIYQNALNEYITVADLSNNEQAQLYDKAFNKLNLLGKADEEIAEILGVPVGTLSEDIRKSLFEQQIGREDYLWKLQNTPSKDGTKKEVGEELDVDDRMELQDQAQKLYDTLYDISKDSNPTEAERSLLANMQVELGFDISNYKEAIDALYLYYYDRYYGNSPVEDRFQSEIEDEMLRRKLEDNVKNGTFYKTSIFDLLPKQTPTYYRPLGGIPLKNVETKEKSPYDFGGSLYNTW